MQPVLTIITKAHPAIGAKILTSDLRTATYEEKQSRLRNEELRAFSQRSQRENPDSVITFSPPIRGALLSTIATGLVGIQTGDNPQFVRFHWEIPSVENGWNPLQGSPGPGKYFDGRSQVLLWENGNGRLMSFVRSQLGPGRESAWIRGRKAWGGSGVVLSRAGDLPASLYSGQLFLDSAVVIFPAKASDLAAIYAFCSSPEYSIAVRRINRKLIVTNKTLAKVPFDIEVISARSA